MSPTSGHHCEGSLEFKTLLLWLVLTSKDGVTRECNEDLKLWSNLTNIMRAYNRLYTTSWTMLCIMSVFKFLRSKWLFWLWFNCPLLFLCNKTCSSFTKEHVNYIKSSLIFPVKMPQQSFIRLLLISGVRKGGWGVNFSHWRFKKRRNNTLFGTIRRFLYRDIRNCCRVFLRYPTCLLILRNFHSDAIIAVIKLFWWAALEPTTNSKCKPGQSQSVLLKLESCGDVIKPLLSTAIMVGQHNVPASNLWF